MTILAAIIHPFGLSNECLNKKCRAWHIKWDYTSRNRTSFKVIKALSILPIVGQVVGAFMLLTAVHEYKCSQDRFERIEAVSYITKSVLVLLGLGILCLILDIIVSLAILLKNFILEQTNEFERFKP